MRVRETIDIAANVATVGVAVLISAVLIKVYLVAPSQAGRFAQSTAATNGLAPLAEAAVGASLKDRIPGVDWHKNGRTLVLAISTECHFCKDSVPFYRRLQQQAGNRLKIVAILPQSVSEAAEYLKGEGVHADQVKQVSMAELGVQGTPTMLLVDSGGNITRVWVGKIQPEQEQQVLTDLEKG